MIYIIGSHEEGGLASGLFIEAMKILKEKRKLWLLTKKNNKWNIIGEENGFLS